MYNHELVSELKDIHKQIFHDNVHDENIWSLSIEDLQEVSIHLWTLVSINEHH